MYLLDTNVVSELRRPDRGDSGVVAWVHSVPEFAQFISAVTLLELQIGALLLKRRAPVQGDKLWTWVHHTVIPSFAGRILAFDAETSLLCAPLHVPSTPPERDAMIAATALKHRFTVVTRDVHDFEPMGVPLLNPWRDA